jgi:hypothetical protein
MTNKMLASMTMKPIEHLACSEQLSHRCFLFFWLQCRGSKVLAQGLCFRCLLSWARATCVGLLWSGLLS